MKPIYKFILHVVHNSFPLNEYNPKLLQQIIDHYRQEADDLGIEITDDQLKKYVEYFDRIKPSIISKGGTDLIKQGGPNGFEIIVPLSKLIKIITSTPGAEKSNEKADDTPDVVYHEEPYIIWNGSKEGNCIKYGAGEKWCITRGSFSSYRYSSGRDYPVFYLAKNNSLPDTDKLSFVAIQVRDTEREDRRYVYTNRKNSPYESNPMSWEQLNSEIPWLRNIPNVKSIMKYIPLSSQEKLTQKYAYDAIGVREWLNFPFETKKQYLVVRSARGQFFSDIENETFIEKYLPKYPQIANFIAITPGIVSSKELLKTLDKFSNQDRKSITANLRDKIDLKYLSTDYLPWDVKKLLTTLNKWEAGQNDRLYVTKDGSAIVRLKINDDDVKVGVHTEEDDYPNVKLNKRTSKFLLDYPELDKIPFKNLMKLVVDDVIDRSVVAKVLEDAKTNPNSAIIVKQIESGEIVLDSNSFASYKIDKDGGILPVPFDNEEVQTVFDDAKDNEGFQQNALALISSDSKIRIPKSVDRKAFVSILRSIPLNKRAISWRDQPAIVLTTENDKILVMSTNRGMGTLQLTAVYGDYEGGWTNINNGYYSQDPAIYRAWFTYLDTQNKKFNDQELLSALKSAGQYTNNSRVGRAIIEANPPMVEGSLLKPVLYNGAGYIVNTQTPRESYFISSNTGKLIKANLSPAQAATLLGLPAPAATAAGRRGRPAGQANAPRPQAAAPAAGDIDVGEVMQETGLDTAFLRLPRSIIRRLNVNNASRIAPNGDRGAARRNNQLGGRGQVGRILAVGNSKIYIIRLANGQIIASINVQPGNYNYILTGNESGNNAISLNSPSDLVQVLTQRGLAEIRRYITNEYLQSHPEHLDEVKNMLTKHLDEINAKKALATGALTLGLMGTPSLAKSQNTLGGKIGDFIKKIHPTVKVDTVKVQKDTPLQLAKFKDYKGAGYGYAKSPNESAAYKIAKQNATQDLLSKIGQQRIVAGIEEKAVKHYENPDGTHEFEVLLVIGN